MLKSLALLPIALLPFACGSSKSNNDGAAANSSTFGGSSSTSGGSTSLGTGGGISLALGGSGPATAGSGAISTDTATDLENQACAGTKIEPESLPAVLQLVVDTSASMAETTRATNGQSKWAITRDALRDTIASLPSNIALGLLYFPNRQTSAGTTPRDVSECVNVSAMIPIGLLADPNSAQRTQLDTSLQNTMPAGSTPTHDAYTYALQNSLLKTTAQGARYMVLITDGAPTLALQCLGGGLPTTPQPTQPIIDTIQSAYLTDQVKTFLIGSPGSEDNGNGGDDRPWLSTAAVLGGTAQPGCDINGPSYCHIDLTQAQDFSASLRAGLNYVAGQVVSCSYDVPATGDNGDPINPAQINVIYTPGNSSTPLLIKEDASAGCTDGWQLNNGIVNLCTNTCNQVKADNGGKLELLFGCDTQTVPVK